MGGYSKIKDINTPSTNNEPKSSPSKSVTDSPSDPSKNIEPIQTEPMKQEQEHEQEQEKEDEDVKGKLRRNFSTTASRFMRLDRQNSSSIVSSKALQGALRRAFSVRSSSSEKYSRIYSDRPVALASPYEEDGDVDDEEDGDAKDGSGKKDAKEKKHKSSRIIRACKRILGL